MLFFPGGSFISAGRAQQAKTPKKAEAQAQRGVAFHAISTSSSPIYGDT